MNERSSGIIYLKPIFWGSTSYLILIVFLVLFSLQFHKLILSVIMNYIEILCNYHVSLLETSEGNIIAHVLCAHFYEMGELWINSSQIIITAFGNNAHMCLH